MAKEIERKFLVKDESFRTFAEESHHICQGYISVRPEATVRVRTIDTHGYITVKGITAGCSRNEWEYPIPYADAQEMLNTISEGVIIDKTRHIVSYEGCRWEIDEFHHPRKGLIIAEIELESEDSTFLMPPFVGDEVTGNPSYYNSAIASDTSSSDR